MKLQKRVNKSNFYTDYVNILNGVLQLSPREAEVFSYLLLYNDIGYEGNVNHRKVRSDIKKLLGISEANLSRYLNTIKVKGLIIKSDNNKWIINDNIKPVLFDNQVEIDFILNIYDDERLLEKAIGDKYTRGVDPQA